MPDYQKAYLGFINIPTLLSFIIASECFMLLSILLGGHGEDVYYFLATGVGFLIADYLRRKLNIDIVISFISSVIGLFITALLL